jgi:hypothetical protein
VPDTGAEQKVRWRVNPPGSTRFRLSAPALRGLKAAILRSAEGRESDTVRFILPASGRRILLCQPVGGSKEGEADPSAPSR